MIAFFIGFMIGGIIGVIGMALVAGGTQWDK